MNQNNTVLECKNLTKEFKIKSYNKNKLITKKLKALDNLNFKLQAGQCDGIIGRNGSGKSTLLKLITCITLPTSGAIKIKGKVSSMLEVDFCFQNELTGKENVFLTGSILGKSILEIKEKYDQIVEFSTLEDFMETPLSYYSSGMRLKLGFSVFSEFVGDILLLDEVISVGDESFAKKSFQRIQDKIKELNSSVLFVSHNLDQVINFCENSYVMDQGRFINYGPSSKMIDYYKKEVLKL